MIVIINPAWTDGEPGKEKIYYFAAMRVDELWRKTDGIEIALSEEAPCTDNPYLSYYRRGASDKLITEKSERGIMRRFAEWIKPNDTFCVYAPATGRAFSETWRRVFKQFLQYPIVFAGPKICRTIQAVKGYGEIKEIHIIADTLGIHLNGRAHNPMDDVMLLAEIARKLGVSYKSLAQDSTRPEYYADKRERNRALLLRTEYNYVYVTGSDVFHSRYCHCVLNSDNIKGSVYYETAADGRRPCRMCKPVPYKQPGKEEADKAKSEGGLPPAGRSQVVTVSLLGGKPVSISKGKLVGYCHYKLHPGRLTKTLMDEHGCISKECKFFEKYEDSPYWMERKRRKEEKEKSRQRKRALAAAQFGEDVYLNDLRDIFQTVSDETCSDMLIVRVKKETYIFEIYYVSDNPFADGNRFPEFLAELRKRYPKNRIVLRHIKDMDGRYVTREEFRRIKRKG